ncbi:MAG: helix-turn-helix domain-containing protein [Planctomycetota bacterium]|jgi:hypothetical protein|nr:helix-turn-helix domain-containing protein [Planctomycetota bacterium]MDP6503800.1 helix-turn-helix domain-containing protein [Planctomycetota bacterium]
MTCETCKNLLSEFDSKELEENISHQVQGHLESCPACTVLLSALKQTDSLLAKLDDEEPPRSLCLRILNEVDDEKGLVSTDLPDIITPEQLARFLRLPLQKLETENLPAFEIGGEVRYRRDCVLRWMEDRERDYERRMITAQFAAS